jgi:hypothetical protein
MKTHFQTALEALGAYAVPIMTLPKKTQSPFLVGTATLFRFDTELFLITAKHVVDNLDDGLIITSGKTGHIKFSAEMAAFEYEKGSGLDHDICVIRLAPEVEQNLHGHFKIADEHQVSTVLPYDKLVLYAFVGYPHSKNKPKPNAVASNIEWKPFYYALRERRIISELHTADKSEEFHVAFCAPFDKMMDVSLSRRIQPPTPYGISGCGVWQLILNRDTGAVDSCMLVAVGIEYLRKDDAFVATRIHSPLAAIAQFTRILANERA